MVAVLEEEERVAAAARSISSQTRSHGSKMLSRIAFTYAVRSASPLGGPFARQSALTDDTHGPV